MFYMFDQVLVCHLRGVGEETEAMETARCVNYTQIQITVHSPANKCLELNIACYSGAILTRSFYVAHSDCLESLVCSKNENQILLQKWRLIFCKKGKSF